MIPEAKEYKGKEFRKVWIDPKIAAAILAKENRGNKTISESDPTISMLNRIAKANGKHLKVSFV